jgi:1-acyl-sn-glycerol-3-phosphate acyltransferase
MNKGKEQLSKGISIIIFPQSTRSAVFNPNEFNSLGVKVAKAAGVKVLPVALKTDFWGNGRYLKDVGPVSRDKPIHMMFGTPMEIKGTGKNEHKEIVQFIIQNLQHWGAVVQQ